MYYYGYEFIVQFIFSFCHRYHDRRAEKTLDVVPTVIDGRTLVPVRFISESLGCSVDWDEATETVIITSK